jgi:hypothetical protein
MIFHESLKIYGKADGFPTFNGTTIAPGADHQSKLDL